MSDHTAIDNAIKRMMTVTEQPEPIAAGRERAERRLEVLLRVPEPRRRPSRVPRLAIALACLVFLVSGVAVAATTDLADRILGSDEPAAERVEAVREDQRPAMTQDDLVSAFTSANVEQQIGDGLDSTFGPALVADDRARVSARRTAEGDICMTLSEKVSLQAGEPVDWRPSGASCGTFVDGWPLMDSVGAQVFTGRLSYGLIADGVSEVRFIADEEPFDATMGRGAFIWRHPEGVEPTDIEVVLVDGTVVRRDLTWIGTGQGPAAPRIVRPNS